MRKLILLFTTIFCFGCARENGTDEYKYEVKKQVVPQRFIILSKTQFDSSREIYILEDIKTKKQYMWCDGVEGNLEVLEMK